MITLTTILNLHDREQQKFLREVDNAELALALQCDDNDELITSLAGNMSKRSAEAFIEQLSEAKNAVEQERQTLADSDALPDSVAKAREKMLAVVARLSESGEITIPEVEIPRMSALFEKRISDAKQQIRETICALQENRAVLRKYIIEEAEKHDELSENIAELLDGYGTEGDLKLLERDFMSQLEKFTAGFFKTHLVAGGHKQAKDALRALGSEGRRQLKARLLSSHYDSLLRAIEKSTFSIEDIALLSDRDVQKLLREVDNADLAKALSGVDYEVQAKIYRNMTPRRAEMLKEDIQYMAPLQPSFVNEAQDKILGAMKLLEDIGEIVITR